MALLSLGIAGCQSPNPYADAALRHRAPDGFRNNYTDSVPSTALDLLHWRWNAWRNDLPPPPAQPTPPRARQWRRPSPGSAMPPPWFRRAA
jgi:N-acyl-phosphatidylethanolamine-hydrolysing phospholipase D